MLLLSFLFFFVKSDTETFLKVFNKVKDSPIQELTRSDEGGLPGGHYAWTGDSHLNAVSLVFKEFSILEITVEHVLFQLEGPVFVIMKGNGNIVDLVGNGINFPFIESTSTNLIIHCKSHRQVESCTLQTYVALSDNSQTASVDYDQSFYKKLDYRLGDEYYLCGYEKVNIEQVTTITSANRAFLLLEHYVEKRGLCGGDVEINGAGVRRLKAALDPLKQEIKTQLQTVEDGQTFSAYLERGSYSLTTGDGDVKLSSTELVYLEIVPTSSHYNLELKGPIYVYGQAQAVDATIIVDAENKTSPYLAITGDDLKLTMKREGKTDEDFKIFYGNIRYNWKVNKKQNGINHVYETTFYGFVLGYNNVDFYTFSGITDPYTDSNAFQVDVIYAKIPLSAAAIISIIVVSVVVVVGGIIAGVVVYCVVIKPKKQAKENNPPAV